MKSNIDFRKPENDVSLRTVHMRGFPTSATLDDLLEGLKPYGNSTPLFLLLLIIVVRFIEMRRFVSTREFKGSVNVEFETAEEAAAFMKKKIMFAGVEITEKQLLSEREKEFEERNKRLSFCRDSIVQIRNIGADTTTEKLREVLKPYLTEYSFVLHSEGENQAMVRFATCEEAAKAVEALKTTTIAEKPLKLQVLKGKKANGVWTKMKALMIDGEKAKKGEKRERENEEEGEEEAKKAKLD